MALQVWSRLEVRYRSQAKPGDRSHPFGDAQQLREEILPVERYPTDSPSLRCCCQPQVLYGQAYRVQPGIGDGVPTENVWCSPARIVGDHQGATRVHHTVDPYPGEATSQLGAETRCERLTFRLDMLPELRLGSLARHEHEVPWLAEPDTRCAVRCRYHAHENAPVEGFACKLRPHVAPTFDHLVEVDTHDPPR